MSEKAIRPFLQPLRIYAVCGFILSLALHLSALIGVTPDNKVVLFWLGAAIFPMWVPVVLLSAKALNGLDRKEAWKVLFSGCPAWMKKTADILYWYALINFIAVTAIFFLLPDAFLDTDPASGPESAPRIFWILASSYFMFFYFSGLAVLTTFSRTGMPACPNGHPASLADKYCRTCGGPILSVNGGGPGCQRTPL